MSSYKKLGNTSNRYNILTGYNIPTMTGQLGDDGCQPLPYLPPEFNKTWCEQNCKYPSLINCNTCQTYCTYKCYEGKIGSDGNECTNPSPGPGPGPGPGPPPKSKSIGEKCSKNIDCKSSYCTGGVINSISSGDSYPAPCGFNPGDWNMPQCDQSDMNCRTTPNPATGKIPEYTFQPYSQCTCAINHKCVYNSSGGQTCNMQIPAFDNDTLGSGCNQSCTNNSDCTSGWCCTHTGKCTNVGVTDCNKSYGNGCDDDPAVKP